MKKYFQGLKPFFALRSQEFVGSKIIHKSAKKPNYLIYEGYVNVAGGDALVNVSNPRTKTTYSFPVTDGWFFWEPFVAEVPETNGDTELVNIFIEGINTVMLEKGVKDPRLVSEELGDLFLDLLMGSHRKEEVFDRTRD
jgi:hypothetical protein